MSDLYEFPTDLVVFDLETDGSEEHHIIEIGAVRLSHDFKVLDTFQSLVGGHLISKAGHEHMGGSITDAMLLGQAHFGDVGTIFAEWCGSKSKYVLCAWGAQFDSNTLRNEWTRMGRPYPHPGAVFCAKSAAWWDQVFEPRITSSRAALVSICSKLGLEFEGTPHRALDDARMAARVLMESHQRRMARIT